MLLIRSKRLRVLCGVFETLSYLSLKLWIKNPARARSFAGKVFRAYMSLVGEDKWKCQRIEKIIPHLTEKRIIIENTFQDGLSTPLDELAYLALIVRNLDARAIFEIGTYRGRTALNFALNTPPECVVHTLDLPPEKRSQAAHMNPADAILARNSEPGACFHGKDVASKIQQLYGDSTTFDFQPYFGKMDVVFIDGAHHYEAARSDTVNALKLARPGGMIIWHDFGNYGDYNDVTRAVLDLLPGTDVIQIDNTQLAVYWNRSSTEHSAAWAQSGVASPAALVDRTMENPGGDSSEPYARTASNEVR